MADLGFLPGVKRLLDQTPKHGQRMLFSATLDNGVDVLVKRYLHDPVTHSVDSAQSPVSAMVHHVLHVDSACTRERADRPGRVAGPHHRVRAHQARREGPDPPSSIRAASPPSSCTATCLRTPAPATSRRSPTAPPR